MCSKFLLVPHNVFPHSHWLGQSDAIRKLILEVFDFRQAIPLQEYFQCIHKPGTTFNGSMDSVLDSYHAASLCNAFQYELVSQYGHTPGNFVYIPVAFSENKQFLFSGMYTHKFWCQQPAMYKWILEEY